MRAYINVKRLDDAEYVNNNYIIMCTKDGTIKKTKLEAYSRPRQNGVNAIVIREGDQLIEAKLTSGNAEVMIAAREGKAIRFNENTVRPIGRVGAGVRGISLDEGDEVVGMICIEPNSSQDVLVLSENGYGKRTDLDEYRITNRGGKGVKTINITEKTRQADFDPGRDRRERPDDYQPFGADDPYGGRSDPCGGTRYAGRAYHQPA